MLSPPASAGLTATRGRGFGSVIVPVLPWARDLTG
ncbi:hypothetical protein J2S41_004807 [Catenuloplanes atrovinosus]|uniref:Uncharacterized protein n=1 Tax=Catenuloplanes atrovinosus TaxID=137266 RepID=A0AAE3YQM5_9ACTN|nr:hypothetical protein [Catenuloplanes atrovinosus]